MKKLKKLIYNPFALIVLWTMFLLYPLVSVLKYSYIIHASNVSIPVQLLLSFTYKVYGPIFLSLSLVIIVVWVKRFIDGKVARGCATAVAVVALTSAIFNFIAEWLLDFDIRYYPNYLYSTYGVRPEDLKFISTANYIIFGLVVGLLFVGINRILKKGATSVWTTDANIILTTLGLVILLFLSLYPFSNIRTLLRIPKEDYKVKIGWRYVYIEGLSTVVPEDAKIIHPPQGSKWPEIGNQPIIRFFLFPRTLISGALINDQAFVEEIGEAYFPNITDPPWPEINEVNKTITFNEKDKFLYGELETISDKDEIVIYKIKFK